MNEGVVDQPDLPTLAEYEQPGQSHGSVGAGMRQTLLNFEGRGPKLWNGRLSADVSLDFFGGVTAGTDSAPAGIVRMRTAGIAWESSSDLLRLGYEGPLISPLSPTSLATVAEPALAWSGNLWTWAPQLRWEHRFTISDDRQAGFEFGLYDPRMAHHRRMRSKLHDPSALVRQLASLVMKRGSLIARVKTNGHCDWVSLDTTTARIMETARLWTRGPVRRTGSCHSLHTDNGVVSSIAAVGSGHLAGAHITITSATPIRNRVCRRSADWIRQAAGHN